MPIGPNNRIEPGGPDLGQPTHFLPGRQTGTFVITVPKTFARRQRLTWTLTINGQTNAIPLRLNPDYNISPLKDSSVGNTPPMIRFAEGGPIDSGAEQHARPARSARRRRSPRRSSLPVWADDDAKYTNNSSSPMRGSRPPVTLTLVEVSRARHRHVRQAAPDAGQAERRRRERAVPGHGHDDGEVQRTGRVRLAGDRERLLGRGRRRVPVLLDQLAGQGHRHALGRRLDPPREVVPGTLSSTVRQAEVLSLRVFPHYDEVQAASLGWDRQAVSIAIDRLNEPRMPRVWFDLLPQPEDEVIDGACHRR